MAYHPLIVICDQIDYIYTTNELDSEVFPFEKYASEFQSLYDQFKNLVSVPLTYKQIYPKVAEMFSIMFSGNPVPNQKIEPVADLICCLHYDTSMRDDIDES